MQGVAATAVLALAAGCCAYPHSSRQVGNLQEPPPPTTFRPPLAFANEGSPEDCDEPDTFSGIFPRSSFGGFCCVFCPDNEGNIDALICCPTIDEHRQEVINNLKSNGNEAMRKLIADVEGNDKETCNDDGNEDEGFVNPI